jgi:hypothetical protein
MKPFMRFKLSLDALMTISLLGAMAHLLIGDSFHEYNGAALLVLFIVHNALNIRFYSSLFRGSYPPSRILKVTINLLTLIAILGSIASGIILSQKAFWFVSVSGLTALARNIHLASVYWSFALISAHLGLHSKIILSLMKIGGEKKKTNKLILRIGRVAGVLLSIAGARAFLSHNIFSYMTLKTRFAFFDTERPLIYFFADYISMMIMFAWIAHYGNKLAERAERAGRRSPEKKEDPKEDPLTV